MQNVVVCVFGWVSTLAGWVLRVIVCREEVCVQCCHVQAKSGVESVAMFGAKRKEGGRFRDEELPNFFGKGGK